MTTSHKLMMTGDIHAPFGWNVASATARAALVVGARDIGRLAKQADDGSVWELKSVGPAVWGQWLTGAPVTDPTARAAVAEAGSRGLKRSAYAAKRRTIWPSAVASAPTFSTTGPGGSSSISSPQTFGYNTPKVRYIGIPVLLNALGSNYYSNNANGTAASGATTCAIEFEHYGQVFEIVFRNAVANGSMFWVWVNDPVSGNWIPTTAAPVTSTAATVNSYHFFKTDFGTSSQRMVRVYMMYADFGGINIGSADDLWPTPAPMRSLCAIMDSFGGGGTNSVGQMYVGAVSLARLLDVDLYLNAVGGTGYVTQNASLGGNNNFSNSACVAAAIASGATDFLLCGSINDQSATTSDVTTQATSLISQIKAALPLSTIWAQPVQTLSPSAMSTGNNAANDAALRVVFAANSVKLIDDAAWYNSANRASFLGADNIHRSQAGHDNWAARTYQEMLRLGW